MELDNSAASAFRTCPWLYKESYLSEGTGLEPRPNDEYGPLDLGKRVHEMLEEHYLALGNGEIKEYPASANADLEAEAQLIMEAYRAAYPSEDFTVVDVERSIRVALPHSCPVCQQSQFVVKSKHHALAEGFYFCEDCREYFWPGKPHIYTGKIDLCIRQSNGMLAIIDHKTEKRTSRNNSAQKWAARDQATLYLWAAERIYGEPIESFIVNVLRRPDKKNGPEFPERQKLERTRAQIDTAVRDITIIANQIEEFKARFGEGQWPANRENCVAAFGQCPFYTPHLMGWSADIRRLMYQPKTPYLTLAGVPIIQNNS